MDELDAKIEELREATRAANEVLKDIKAAIRESRGIAAETVEEVRKEFEEKFTTVAKETLDEWTKLTLRGIDIAEERVNKRFDKLGDILMGEEKKDSRPPLTEVVQDWMVRKQR